MLADLWPTSLRNAKQVPCLIFQNNLVEYTNIRNAKKEISETTKTVIVSVYNLKSKMVDISTIFNQKKSEFTSNKFETQHNEVKILKFKTNMFSNFLILKKDIECEMSSSDLQSLLKLIGFKKEICVNFDSYDSPKTKYMNPVNFYFLLNILKLFLDYVTIMKSRVHMINFLIEPEIVDRMMFLTFSNFEILILKRYFLTPNVEIEDIKLAIRQLESMIE